MPPFLPGADSVCLNSCTVNEYSYTEATLCRNMKLCRTPGIPKTTVYIFEVAPLIKSCSVMTADVCSAETVTHGDFMAFDTKVTSNILTSLQIRTWLLAVWSLSSTVLRYLSLHCCTTTQPNGIPNKRCGIAQPWRCETERNWSQAHFLCRFLMGFFKWVVGRRDNTGK